MQLLPILMVATLLARDAIAAPGLPLSPAGAIAATLGANVLVLLFVAGGLLVARRQLDRGAAVAGLRLADRTGAFGRFAVIAVHAAAVLAFGWLDVVRELLGGDLVAIDEIVALVPACAAMTALFALHYPIERRVREAMVIRHLDAGRSIYRMPSRARYAWTQLRTNLLFMLVPVVTILAGTEGIRVVLAAADVRVPWVTEVLSLAVGLLVFACAPFIARLVLTVEPLAPGPIRDDLLEICRTHRVRVRNLLVWQTDGAVVNAAVMGLVGRLRYVLLTDALLDILPGPQLRAVMAHEIGHVRRRHLPWLALVLLAVVLLLSTLMSLGFVVADVRLPPDRTWIVDLGATTGTMTAALLVFGWVSRRFERQADTFAVAHLSRAGVGPAPAAHPDHIAPEAVATMCGALGSIARLNSIPTSRRSWRHGSIAWRQAYLTSLVGRARDDLAIDRLIRRIKFASIGCLVAGVAAIAVLEVVLADAAPSNGDAAIMSPSPRSAGS